MTRTGVVVLVECLLHSVAAVFQRNGQVVPGNGEMEQEPVEELFDEMIARHRSWPLQPIGPDLNRGVEVVEGDDHAL